MNTDKQGKNTAERIITQVLSTLTKGQGSTTAMRLEIVSVIFTRWSERNEVTRMEQDGKYFAKSALLKVRSSMGAGLSAMEVASIVQALFILNPTDRFLHEGAFSKFMEVVESQKHLSSTGAELPKQQQERETFVRGCLYGFISAIVWIHENDSESWSEEIAEAFIKTLGLTFKTWCSVQGHRSFDGFDSKVEGELSSMLPKFIKACHKPFFEKLIPKIVSLYGQSCFVTSDSLVCDGRLSDIPSSLEGWFLDQFCAKGINSLPTWYKMIALEHAGKVYVSEIIKPTNPSTVST